ncbi:MAG: DUF2191 domain-containing protein [Acidobacteriia bacterium]|nr:DUF2191 domain-containing protein [Terriglobia bacterium]
MRTTLTIDDRLAHALRKKAYQSGKSFKEVVNCALQAGIQAEHALPKSRPYKIKPASLGGVLPGINIDKALRLADEIETMEIAGKLRLRK